MRTQLVTAFLVGLLALPATASADAFTSAEQRGIPFSMADLSWIALDALLLLVLSLTLQAIARHRRRTRAAAVSVAPQRTEP